MLHLVKEKDSYSRKLRLLSIKKQPQMILYYLQDNNIRCNNKISQIQTNWS